MHRPDPRTILLAAILAAASTAAFAQAPVERRPLPPAPVPVPIGVSAWPDSSTLKPGTHLIVTTTSYLATPFSCELRSLDPDRIVCKGHRNRNPVTFDRNLVASITEVHVSWAHHFGVGFFAGSVGLIAVGAACALAGGGTACGVVASAGLVASLFAWIFNATVHGVDLIRGPNFPTPIYIAPPPPAPAP